MDDSRDTAWLADARWYYSLIAAERADPVSVFDATGCDEVTGSSPGRLCLRLEPRFRLSPRVRVLAADGREAGTIRAVGTLPGVRYAMCRGRALLWTLSVRSIVRRRHNLELANGESWTFHTPFFKCDVMGTALGLPRLVGTIGPGVWVWQMSIEPGRDTFDMLAAVAFLHRQWFHW